MDFVQRQVLTTNGHFETVFIRKDFNDLIDNAKRINPHCTVWKSGDRIELKIEIKI